MSSGIRSLGTSPCAAATSRRSTASSTDSSSARGSRPVSPLHTSSRRQPSIWLRRNRIGVPLNGSGRHRSSVRASASVDLLGLEPDARGEPGPRLRDEVVEQRVVVEAQAPFVLDQFVHGVPLDRVVPAVPGSPPSPWSRYGRPARRNFSRRPRRWRWRPGPGSRRSSPGGARNGCRTTGGPPAPGSWRGGPTTAQMAASTTLDRLVRVRAATRRTAIAAATDDSSTASDSPLARAPGRAYRQWGIRRDCSCRYVQCRLGPASLGRRRLQLGLVQRLVAGRLAGRRAGSPSRPAKSRLRTSIAPWSMARCENRGGARDDPVARAGSDGHRHAQRAPPRIG